MALGHIYPTGLEFDICVLKLKAYGTKACVSYFQVLFLGCLDMSLLNLVEKYGYNIL